jgi:endogenous inhibitor of DNA gyrase (YacG/DUF329 family)
MRTITCEYCGTTVVARRPHRRFCSSKCRHSNWTCEKAIARGEFCAKPRSFHLVTLPGPKQ